MSSLRILCRDLPHRTIALVTTEYALIFQHGSIDAVASNQNGTPRCLVEFSNISSIDWRDYRFLGEGYGTLGLITLDEDVFLCVVTGSSKAATVRPGETVSRIDNVDFFCLTHSEFEYGMDYGPGSQPTAEELSRAPDLEGRELVTDHPFIALKKLLGDGSFYYSLDFNLTDRLQDRSDKSTTFDIETLDEDMLWNSYMINPLLLFRGHLPPLDRVNLDSSQILTCVIRGFASTLRIPASVPLLPQVESNLPSTFTIISRQSSRRAGTRFNSRGIDDDGNVANFVETELILWIPTGITFSYVQVRGSVPIFWEQTAGFLPGQQKIEVTRSTEATQHAFNRHFEFLELEYGAVHVVNLLSEFKPGEVELSTKLREHIKKNRVKRRDSDTSDHTLLRMTEFDFHAETRGPLGYGASSQIKYDITHSSHGFGYFLSEDFIGATSSYEKQNVPKSSSVILQQEGVFRTNCLDCLDRTNLVQTMISSMALESFLFQQGGTLHSDVQARHSTLWADNGDALSKIYAGTGALKSSFTRHGKMSLAGALADARKTATRLYVNNFSDKARQKTIDLLLGRLTDQMPVHLHDPVNDVVSEELGRRASEYSFSKSIKIWAGTFNVNGRSKGPDVDLTPWFFPEIEEQNRDPEIFAVGFQEIVELSPQQIMSTDPTTRKVWENAVRNCLNDRSRSKGAGKYVLLRSGQLVGAALMIYVKEDALKQIKNVEGSVKKTGLSGIGGNKGGCAIRFEYSNTRICFITAHLAAGFANYDERNNDYETIDCGLRFQKNRSIEDHDTIIWLGDFNYRIGLGNQIVRDLILQGDYQRLYDNDQLNLQMITGRAFQFYSEGRILFPPTYKYDIGSDEYDTSEKARIPAWCDRVLWKGTNTRQTHYDTADLRLSDHRPVWATFDCMINIIDESLKSKIRRMIYEDRQCDVRDMPANKANLIDTEDGEVMSHGSIAPGLPPASSDHHRWWLENGASSRSELSPPAYGSIVNVYRNPNPFSQGDEYNWVFVPDYIGRQMNSNTAKDVISPKFPVSPGIEIQDASPMHSGNRDPAPSKENSGDDSIPSSAKRNNDAKTPPEIPRKPVFLSSKVIEGDFLTLNETSRIPLLGKKNHGNASKTLPPYDASSGNSPAQSGTNVEDLLDDCTGGGD
ncbi:hypothetical protein AWENTII_008459 [Aspergillus wentii]